MICRKGSDRGGLSIMEQERESIAAKLLKLQSLVGRYGNLKEGVLQQAHALSGGTLRLCDAAYLAGLRTQADALPCGCCCCTMQD